MRNKSKNRIKQEMRIRLFMLERENKLLRDERDLARHFEIYFRTKWESTAPRLIFEPSSIMPIRVRNEAPLGALVTAAENCEASHWVKQRLLEQISRAAEEKELFFINRVGNSYEATAFLAIPKQIPEPVVRAAIFGDFEAAADKVLADIREIHLREVR